MLLLAFCVCISACKRQEPPKLNSPDALAQPYLGHAITVIPEESKLTQPKYTKVLAASLRPLNLSDPIKDLDAHLGRGDTKFVGINGYSCSPPGLDQNATGSELTADQRLQESRGVVCIEGTGDVLPADRQYMDLYQTAWKYAETYNLELLGRIRRGQVN
jgi:hypothetical protein